jgi:hypothetical protein
MSTEAPVDKILEKVVEAISNQPSAESTKEENSQFKCLHHFGYLSELAGNRAIPEECLFCPQVVKCIVNL